MDPPFTERMDARQLKKEMEGIVGAPQSAAYATVAAVLVQSHARNLGCEGIPMFLELNGAAAAPAEDERRRDGERLATLLEIVHEALLSNPLVVGKPNKNAANPMTMEERVLCEALSVLAYADFNLEGPLEVATTSGNCQARPTGRLSNMLTALREGRFIRVVNYHNTPLSAEKELANELASFKRRFWPANAADLQELFATGKWEHPLPPLLPVFYEGYLNNFEVAAPLCESMGLTGWFFVITGFVDTSPTEQLLFAQSHHIDIAPEEMSRDRLAMNWGEVAELSTRHVVTTHTSTHAPVTEVQKEEDFEREVYGPSGKMRDVIGRQPPAHAWLYGTGVGEWPNHDASLRKAGFRWCFSNTAIHSLQHLS